MARLPASVCYICSTGLKKMLGYDDSLDVFGVHGVGGIIGAMLTGVFAVEAWGGKAGLLEGNSLRFRSRCTACLPRSPGVPSPPS